MALDGFCVHALTDEMMCILEGSRINKIQQPEKDELLITFATLKNGSVKLLISANPSLPFAYMTDQKKTAPDIAPPFCMLLRKHVGAARVISVENPGFERIIKFSLSHLDEMGDPAVKHLYIELMGKHSNIIFTDENDVIIDAIKRVNSAMSSIRQVLPGKQYFIPTQEGKITPEAIDLEAMSGFVLKKPMSIEKALLSSIIGISPVLSNEIVFSAGFDSDIACASLNDENKKRIFDSFEKIIKACDEASYNPCSYESKSTGAPLDFSPFTLTMYESENKREYSSVSEMLEGFYAAKNTYTNIHARSADLRKILTNLLERTVRKIELQERQLKDTDKMDKYRIYGEMLHTYGYSAAPGDKSITVTNYYDNTELTIPLDPTLSASENAKKYFDRYQKLKRTKEAATEVLNSSKDELEILKSIEASLAIAETEADLTDVKKLLSEGGFIHKTSSKGKEKKAPKNPPYHYVDDNGFDIYVGKNNFQNDELTFKFATGNDWWFHTKKIHGSHVIVKCDGKELPDSTYEYAAELAAYYSMGRDSSKVEIDYLQKKNVKKPAGAAAGFVVYYTNYSLVASPTLEHVKLVSK